MTEGREDSGDRHQGLGDGERVRSFHGHDGDVSDVAFSPDGSRLASTGKDGWLKVWDRRRGGSLERAAQARHGVRRSAPMGRSWPPPGGSRRSVRVLDSSTDRVVSTVRVAGAIDTALSPDGKRVAVATWGAAKWAPCSTWRPARKRSLSRGPTVAPIRFTEGSPEPGRPTVAASSEGTARVWDAETGTVRHMLGHTGFVLSVAWSPDSSPPGHGRFRRHREGVGDRLKGRSGALVAVRTGNEERHRGSRLLLDGSG